MGTLKGWRSGEHVQNIDGRAVPASLKSQLFCETWDTTFFMGCPGFTALNEGDILVTLKKSLTSQAKELMQKFIDKCY